MSERAVRTPENPTQERLLAWWCEHSSAQLYHWAENVLFLVDHLRRVDDARTATIAALLRTDGTAEREDALLRMAVDVDDSRRALDYSAKQSDLAFNRTEGLIRDDRRRKLHDFAAAVEGA
jgi:hypothetical protein